MEAKTKSLSPVMKDALAMIAEHGALERLPGGFWVRPGVRFNGNRPSESYHSTPTVEALVRRGVASYTRWQERQGGARFPIEVSRVEQTGKRDE